MKRKIYYWTPAIGKIGTIKATINSAISLAKFSNDYDVKVINVFGEWTQHKNYLKSNNIEVENLTFDYYNYLPKQGFIASRFSYIIIILISFIPLIFLLKKKKPDYLIIHLLTSLPLLLWNLFNLKTKLIFRISGFVRLNYLRKKLWIKSKKKIFKILCQTEEQKIFLLEEKVFEKFNLTIIPDCIINIKEFKKLTNKNSLKKNSEKNFFLAAGRFTKQKNFIYLIREFAKFCALYPNEKLFIFGEGELKKKMINEVAINKVSQNIKIFDYTDNIYFYMKKSKAFILSSLWEEPGLVIIEAAMCNSFVISSNCKRGPEEFLLKGKAGALFENNKTGDLTNILINYLKTGEKSIFEKKVLAKKNCKKFTMFRHFLKLNKIMNI